MSYQDAPATQMLATHCVVCGRALVDACSVELGIGPECRDGIFPEGVDTCDQKIANEHVHAAAVAAQKGHVAKVIEVAEAIRQLGFEVLADKVSRRFKKGVERTERNADIVIEEKDGYMLVTTPYRRGKKDEFIAAWRAIPGRRYVRHRQANEVPVSSKAAVWALLKRFFPGKWGKGPKGVFRVPTEKVQNVAMTEEEAEQIERKAESDAMTAASQPELGIA